MCLPAFQIFLSSLPSQTHFHFARSPALVSADFLCAKQGGGRTEQVFLTQRSGLYPVYDSCFVLRMCSLNCQAATNSHLQWILTGTVYLYICGGFYRVQRTCTSAVDPKDYSALVTIKFSEALPLLTHAHTVLIATVPGQKYW